MTILYVIIPIAIILVSFFVLIFLWAVKNEQFDDLETPAHKILIDDWNDNISKLIKKRNHSNSYRGWALPTKNVLRLQTIFLWIKKVDSLRLIHPTS